MKRVSLKLLAVIASIILSVINLVGGYGWSLWLTLSPIYIYLGSLLIGGTVVLAVIKFRKRRKL